MKQCTRCGFDFEPPTPDDINTNVCSNCADDLRQEDDAVEISIMIQIEEEEERKLGTGG